MEIIWEWGWEAGVGCGGGPSRLWGSSAVLASRCWPRWSVRVRTHQPLRETQRPGSTVKHSEASSDQDPSSPRGEHRGLRRFRDSHSVPHAGGDLPGAGGPGPLLPKGRGLWCGGH